MVPLFGGVNFEGRGVTMGLMGPMSLMGPMLLMLIGPIRLIRPIRPIPQYAGVVLATPQPSSPRFEFAINVNMVVFSAESSTSASMRATAWLVFKSER